MRFLLWAAGMLFALVPTSAFAIVTFSPCPLNEYGVPFPCNPLSGVIGNIGTQATAMFVGFLLAMIIFYGFKLLFGANEENAQTEVKTAFAYAIGGATLVMGATVIASAFMPSAAIVTVGPITAIINNVLDFIFGLGGTALIVAITIQGIRMIVAQEEGQASEARKNLIYAMIGAAVLILARVIVESVTGTGQLEGSELSAEISGIVGFLATIFGVLALIAIIIGGFMLVISYDESLKEKGKKSIITGLVALAVVSAAQAIINFVIF